MYKITDLVQISQGIGGEGEDGEGGKGGRGLKVTINMGWERRGFCEGLWLHLLLLVIMDVTKLFGRLTSHLKIPGSAIFLSCSCLSQNSLTESQFERSPSVPG